MDPMEFDGELWLWDARQADSWTFVSVPPELSEEIRDRAAARPPAGFGSVRVCGDDRFLELADLGVPGRRRALRPAGEEDSPAEGGSGGR